MTIKSEMSCFSQTKEELVFLASESMISPMVNFLSVVFFSIPATCGGCWELLHITVTHYISVPVHVKVTGMWTLPCSFQEGAFHSPSFLVSAYACQKGPKQSVGATLGSVWPTELGKSKSRSGWMRHEPGRKAIDSGWLLPGKKAASSLLKWVLLKTVPSMRECMVSSLNFGDVQLGT